MGHILSQRNRVVLAGFAQSNSMAAFDFDGTLAAIVTDPADAQMRDATRSLLQRVCALYPTMVISGRACADVRARLGGVGVRAVVGNHGAEVGDTSHSEKLVIEWKARLESATAALPGVWVEDKGVSLAVHYRLSPSKAAARRKILTAANQLHGARLVPAKQSFSVVPLGAPHKGIALETQRAEWDCDIAMFVGDDVTDEDVFSLRTDALIGVRVGRKRSSHASFWLRDQSEIDALLRLLAELKEESTAK